MKADFLAMLGESDAITERSQWKKMKGLFEQDPRYKAMDSSSKREALFKDYIQSLVEKSQVSKIHCKQRCLIVNFLMFFSAVRPSARKTGEDSGEHQGEGERGPDESLSSRERVGTRERPAEENGSPAAVQGSPSGHGVY